MSENVFSNRFLPGHPASGPTRDRVPAGAILAAGAWLVFVAALIASPWVRDAIATVAAQVPPGML